MSVAKNALNLYAIQGANILIPLLSLPYLGRALGTTGFGTLALSQLILQYIILMTDFGFNLTATRRISNTKDDPKAVSKILYETTVVRLFLAIFGIALALLTSYAIPSFGDARLVIEISFLAVIGSLLTPAWLFHGIEKNSTLAAITIAPRLAFLIPTALYISSPDDLILAAFFQFLPQLTTGLLSVIWILALSPYRFSRPTISGILLSAKDGYHIFASSILTSIYVYANGIILQLTAGSAALGVYAAAEKLIKAVNSMINPAIQAIYPRVCRGEGADLKKLQAAIICITASCWGGALLFGPTLTSLIFGDGFREAGEILKILAIAPIFSGLAAISVQLKIIAWGEHPRLKYIYATSVITHAIQAPLIISFFGAKGAAYSIVLTEIITFSAVAWVTRRIEKGRTGLTT